MSTHESALKCRHSTITVTHRNRPGEAFAVDPSRQTPTGRSSGDPTPGHMRMHAHAREATLLHLTHCH
jgi:hypothetical protein